MKKIKELLKKYKEIILYVIFGVATTIVNLIAFKLLNLELGEDRYLISNVLAWFISVVFAYITNKIWVFESKSWKPRALASELPSFFGARVFSLLLEEAGLYLSVDLLHFDQISINIFSIEIGGKMLAKIILAVIVIILNYIFSKFIIFKKKGTGDPS